MLLAWNFKPASWKNKTENISAIDAQDVGCPLLLTCTELTESILNQLAISSYKELSTAPLVFFLGTDYDAGGFSALLAGLPLFDIK